MAALEIVQNTAPQISPDLIAESNHRIANHLTLLVSLVQMQDSKVARGPETLTRAEVQSLLRETTSKIVSVGSLHRRLAHTTSTAQIDLGSYLIEYAKELLSTFAITRNVSVVERVDANCLVTPEQAQAIMLIVGEIAMNAIKHSHPAGLPTCLSITCARNADGSTTLDIADDGVGLPENFNHDKDTGLGLKLIRTLTHKIGATLDIESDSLGLGFRLNIPNT